MYDIAVEVSKCSRVSLWPIRDSYQATQGPRQPCGQDPLQSRTAQNDPIQEAGTPACL